MVDVTARVMPHVRVPRLRRISRRALLTDFGAAGLGVIILGACAGSSSDSNAGSDPESSGSGDSGPRDSGSSSASSPASAPEVSADTAAAPSASEVSGGDLQLQHVSLGFVSAYVLARGSEAAIVDTGGSGSRDAIFEGLAALSAGPSAVRHIVLTHNHGDHIGGLSGLEADLSGATVHVGAADIAAVQTSLPLVEAADGDEIFGMGVVATPGHTPGSISLFDSGSGILVAGDAVNGDGSGGLSGADPDFSSDMDEAGRSVAALAALMPSTVAFGHGGAPVTDDAAAKLAAIG